ncbi:hypothetical protein BB560_006846, partial [Smittium megazygosporum]
TALIQYSSNVEAKRAFSHLDKHIFKGQEISAAIITTQSNKEHRLIVRNLSFKLREKDIFSIFSKVGQVEEVVLPRKFVGGPLKGFAFVQMGNKDDAEKAVAEINGTKIMDRTVAVDFAIPKDKYDSMKDSINADEEKVAENSGAKDEAKNKDEKKFSPDIETTLFVKNIPFETEEDELYELFSEFGKIKYCRIVMDNKTFKSRGTAFVSFWEIDDFKNCYEKNLEAQKYVSSVANPNDSNSDAFKKGKKTDKAQMNSVLLTEAPKTLPSVGQTRCRDYEDNKFEDAQTARQKKHVLA